MAVNNTETEAQAPKEPNTDQVEHLTDSEKANNPDTAQTYIPSEGEYNVTFKTWIVVGILSWSYGVSFWIVPSLSNCMTVVATQLGDPTASAFYVAVYTMTVTIAFMVCGGNALFHTNSCRHLANLTSCH